MTTDVATRPDNRHPAFEELRNSLGPAARLLEGDEDTARRLIQLSMTEVRKNPDLLECSPESAVGALMLCAQYQLEPGPQQHVYFIPRYNKKTRRKEVSWDLGYRGMIELAGRQGVQIAADAVKANDTWRYWRTPDRDHFEHTPAEGDRGPIVRTYAVARYPDGRPPLVHISDLDEIHAARARSEQPNKAWRTDFESMAIKTPVRRLFKWVGSPMLRQAAAHDGTVRVAGDQPDLQRANPAVGRAVSEPAIRAELARGDPAPTPIDDAPELHDLTAGQHQELAGLDVDDDVRHALVHLASAGRTASSKALTKGEQDALMTLARAFGAEAIVLTGDVTNPEAVSIESPDGVALSVDDVMQAAHTDAPDAEAGGVRP